LVTGQTFGQWWVDMRPFVWEDGVMTELPMASGSEGWPGAINDRDQIVGRSGLHAVLWTR
jgi:hypothetical protein